MPNDENILWEDIFAAFIKNGSPEAEAKAKTAVALKAATEVSVRISLSVASTEVLKKPRPQWNGRASGGVVDHLRIAYPEEITTKTLTTSLIYNEDRVFYKRLKRWLEDNDLPDDIVLNDSKKQKQAANTEKLEALGGSLNLGQLFAILRKIGNEETKEVIRLYEVSRKRAQRETRPAKVKGHRTSL